MSKEDVLEKASGLFRLYGVKSVSMDDIAHEFVKSLKISFFL